MMNYCGLDKHKDLYLDSMRFYFILEEMFLLVFWLFMPVIFQLFRKQQNYMFLHENSSKYPVLINFVL